MRFWRNTFAGPLLFFLLALVLDTAVTALGTDYFSAIEREGNPIVRWLWEIFGEARILLPLLWAGVISGAAYFLLKRVKPFLGVWLLYGIGVGHFLGFLSWTPLQTFVYSGNSSSVFYNLGAQVIISAVLGFLFAKIQLRISEKI
ncbi:MAG: hypothetical protein A3J30_03265 [Candidatus Wildermuthbacteria bacterium RIFCSPLOWO2_02_FULL_47_9c]|uniref:DUF5658 domain-containing protein n=2 Tax=Parcubacteria group TaxID=1794811 RepID=A0A837INN2_9BACT|nr:MAG: hypothetical protein UY25_C0004G0068 [Candidatus Yanofskybacteria bacterium GW2011_GWC1_48_11]KKW04496.1 MAG: hypothetical protein UY38_C0001G0063 [Parcubacteria group bacterium GW2011_GWB1_49_12]KKW09247.1 MAG: hypothetical protein UY45_C0001G0133 [Parcubacteria group bacterium GW2011_GWA1_49_26]KKW14114.1 MAG: hypothetical protein UY53_C0003G0034 [Parcubacteria group bacterium GW2011_GWA2_50_10]OHA61496.1 MAG: hypothetical protein A2109_01295 [Candidatus Wildermuthbacteria bacterium G